MLQQNPFLVTMLRDTTGQKSKCLKVNEEERICPSCKILKGSPYIREPGREPTSVLHLSNNNNIEQGLFPQRHSYPSTKLSELQQAAVMGMALAKKPGGQNWKSNSAAEQLGDVG